MLDRQRFDWLTEKLNNGRIIELDTEICCYSVSVLSPSRRIIFFGQGQSLEEAIDEAMEKERLQDE